MDDAIITIYCLCDDFLKAIGHRDDPQVGMSTAEVMTVPLVAATFFGANIDKSRLFLHEYGYMNKMLGKSRLDRRIHAIEPKLWRVLCLSCWLKSSRSATPIRRVRGGLLAGSGLRQYSHPSLCRLYPPEESAGAFRGYVPSKRRYSSTACGCIWW